MFTPQLLLALLVYIIATATPGPSNFAIAHIAMHRGRKVGLVFAGGIVVGSFSWGLLVASGLTPLIHAHSYALHGLKIFGGLCFLYLGWRCMRVGAPPDPSHRIHQSGAHGLGLFVAAILFHLVNPKAMAVWGSIIAIAVPVGAVAATPYLLVALCLPVAIIIFFGNALLFSQPAVVEKYLVYHLAVNRITGAVFLIVGLKMLLEQAQLAW